MKIVFTTEIKFSPARLQRLQQINEIIEEYQGQDLVLTLRQLYYQLVSRDVIPNRQNEYSKLSTLLKDGRMSGIVDWDAIEDRLRKIYVPNEFTDPKHALRVIYQAYEKKRMEGQKNYIEVWVEKDALSGVLTRVTSIYHIPILVNRGYSSASAMFDSYQRFSEAIKQKKEVTILYLGDFDPSGIDMIRDISSRMQEFLMRSYIEDHEPKGDRKIDSKKRAKKFIDWFHKYFKVVPIALTREQIDQYEPPENPAKRTDPRAKDFIDKHGSSSWEVDALRPEVLNQILTDAIEERIDLRVFNNVLEDEKEEKQQLLDIIENL